MVAAFGAGAPTLGVSVERAPTLKRGGTPGWYNNLAFDAAAAESGLFSETLVGDAFLDATRRITSYNVCYTKLLRMHYRSAPIFATWSTARTSHRKN